MFPVDPDENDVETEDQVPDDDNDGTAYPPPPLPEGFRES